MVSGTKWFSATRQQVRQAAGLGRVGTSAHAEHMAATNAASPMQHFVGWQPQGSTSRVNKVC
jgi:hypothetical protein